VSYQAEIAKALGRLGKNGTENPDNKHNSGKLLGEAFMWEAVEKYAKAKGDAAWQALMREGIIPNKKDLQEGEHELAYSPSFVAIARVSAPVKRFKIEEMAKLMRESKYKVPESTTIEMADRAKVPSTSAVSLKIIERG
jgi:hypothetical protein